MPKRRNSAQLKYLMCACGLLAIVVSGLGCKQDGASLNQVSGQVTYKGDPVPLGVIHFTPNSSAGNQGETGFAEIRDGRYDTTASGKGVESGATVVTIDAYSMKNVDPDIKPHGDALILGYRQEVAIGADRMTELDFAID